ncbi:hypothetical protein IR196_22725 (plasmid) [Brucella anthropi]|uniref:hypothetical protein n=1 Tax=Brucella anthropi TaxID=529 RepID=UPI00188B887A|nr:hypothetical protein [Brucella anthropi]QPA29860.1 hypothetical protein IR196_22725 [Brucella anthropi]
MAYLRQARGSLLLLTVPLLVYLGLYIGPLIGVLMQSVDNTQLAKRFDALSEHIERSPTIDDGTAAAILSDLARMTKQERAETGRVLNQEKNGLRRLLMETGADAATIVPTLAGLESFNSAWADMENWHVLQRVASPSHGAISNEQPD